MSEDLGPLKTCRVCREEWPADDEFFYKSPKNKDGLNNACKACDLEQKTRRNAERAAELYQ